jgi:hypothetical protein
MEQIGSKIFVGLALEPRSFNRSCCGMSRSQRFRAAFRRLEAWAGLIWWTAALIPDAADARRKRCMPSRSKEILRGCGAIMLRGHIRQTRDVIRFAVPHALAFTFSGGSLTCA